VKILSGKHFKNYLNKIVLIFYLYRELFVIHKTHVLTGIRNNSSTWILWNRFG